MPRLLPLFAAATLAALPAGAATSTGERHAAADTPPAPAAGPLRPHPGNPRYFTDGTKDPRGGLRAVLLTGAHTWNSLVDMNPSDPPAAFDFGGYLDFLERRQHNFIRLWAWDSFVWDARANSSTAEAGKLVHHVAPLPWPRTGPGQALDGKPKFDLTKFDPAYFARLRERVAAASRRGLYVSVMLFEGWGMHHANRRRSSTVGWAWRAHPFHPDNNVNGIDAGGDLPNGGPHRLGNKAVNAAQEAYVRKVVDTVNDLDNVLYEVINEGGDKEWDWWIATTVRQHERSKPKQHPVGITGHGAEKLADMLASPADWISPGKKDGYGEDPPAWNGNKVSVLDTDHIWGIGGTAAWAWKAFVRGHNPIFMDPYDHRILGKGAPEQWEPLRRALGQTRRLAERLNLAATVPHDELASTKYCLAEPGAAYVVYSPEGGEVTVDLAGADGTFAAEWIEPVEGTVTPAPEVSGGGARRFESAAGSHRVLFLRRLR